MECNKDEAIRAKELAEKKLAEMDTVGAKQFALKAEKLYPNLDGLPQFLAALDVHISAEQKINGQVDWYGVFGVDPYADDDTIRKHYRKLALILHPDKNKSVGAEGAFKILSEAWSVLSDKDRRSAYNKKLNLRDNIYTNVLLEKSATATATGTTSFNGFHDFFNGNHSNSVDDDQHNAAAPPHSAITATFWTTCNSCKMQFEYSRVHVNMNLKCVNCKTPFLAVETLAPSISEVSMYTPLSDFTQQPKFHQVPNTGLGRFSGSSSSTNTAQEAAAAGVTHSASKTLKRRRKESQKGAVPASNINMPPPSPFTAQDAAGVTCPASKTLKRRRKESQKGAVPASNINMPPPASFTAQDAGVTQSASKTLKRSHDESQTGTRMEVDIMQMGVLSQKTHAGLATGSSGGSIPCSAEKKQRRKKKRVDATTMGNNGVSLSSFQKNRSEIGRTNVAGNTLMEILAREVIRKQIVSWKSASLSNASNKPKVSDEEMDKKDEANVKHVPSKKPDHAHKTINARSSVFGSDPATKKPQLMSMNVPDPDFHDFDKDRTEKSFGENQVWAAYDDDDGMPRNYAMIHSVISLKPFKMQMSWLNSKSNAELAPVNWIGSGFYKTSGEFWIGKYEVNRSLNSFSHKVKWSKGRKGTIQIYPRKGDVWALYRNWSSDWNALTPNDVIHKYDMVEVLEDYNEQNGVIVIPLVKVPGFKTVFRKHSEQSKTLVIPKEQLFRLSHQVPSYLLTGEEGQKSCEGCLELDPAATPKELLQVLTEDQVKEMEDSKGSKGKEVMENGSHGEEDIEMERENNGLLVYGRRESRK